MAMSLRVLARFLSDRLLSSGKVLKKEEKVAQCIYIKNTERRNLEKLAVFTRTSLIRLPLPRVSTSPKLHFSQIPSKNTERRNLEKLTGFTRTSLIRLPHPRVSASLKRHFSQIPSKALCDSEDLELSTFLARISACLQIKDLDKAFEMLVKFESSDRVGDQELLNPFTLLKPLVSACSGDGHRVLEFLQAMRISNPNLKFTTSLNCVILQYANRGEYERARDTFDMINEYGSTPNVNSYNCIIFAYGEVEEKDEALKFYKDLECLEIKPNAMTYELIFNLHYKAQDSEAALSVITKMQNAGFIVSEKLQKKVQKLVTKKEKLGRFHETLSYKDNSKPRKGKKAYRFPKKQLISGKSHGVPWEMSIVADEEPDFWGRKSEGRLRKTTRRSER